MLHISGTTDPRGVHGVSFTRAGAGMRQVAADANGVRIESVASGVPRDSHLPGAGVPAGLLIEPARTNRAQRSEDVSHAFWNTGTEGTPITTANARIAPDGVDLGGGTGNADDIEDDDAGSPERRACVGTLGFADTDVVMASVFGRWIAGANAGQMAVFDGSAWGTSKKSAPISAATWVRYPLESAVTIVSNANTRMHLAPATTDFELDWVWSGAETLLTVWKDGVPQAGIAGVWTPPTLGASVFLGADGAGGVQAAGTYSNVRLGRAA